MEKKIELIKRIEGLAVKEDQIQKAFERNLDSFEQGMKYVDSFVRVGVGTIDTLAIDEENVVAIIEFKKPGGSATDALVQALDYYTWCIEPVNFKWLESYVRRLSPQLLPESQPLYANYIRLIIVASEFQDRLKRAVRAFAGSDTIGIMLVSYKFFEKAEGETGLLPVIEVDTSKASGVTPPLPKIEEDHFKGREQLRPLYDQLKEKLRSIDSSIEFNPKPQQYIAFIGPNRGFCWVYVKKNWLRIELPLTPKEAGSELWKETWEDWGYIRLENAEELEEVVDIIRKAYAKAG